ncbi:MAG: FAD binding domain-containing protein [Blautia sp.]
MLTIKNIVKADSLQQAYELNQKASNRVLGGMLWLKMSRGSIQTAIDLSGLGLDTIEETPDSFSIGCMATLRQLEQHPGLCRYTNGAMKESLRSIVGVQFRNMATVGGSIYGRFGFSDVLTMFLSLDTMVELYPAGLISLEEFSKIPHSKKMNDILVRLIVKKVPQACAYISHRNTRTDFPVLTCATYCRGGHAGAVIGARPGKPIIVRDEKNLLDNFQPENIKAFASYVSEAISTGSNLRAGAKYRKHLANVLTRRAFEALAAEETKEGSPS